jgi:endogenous inhibitor of DNA gyrase (YacG/DUF329 family)
VSDRESIPCPICAHFGETQITSFSPYVIESGFNKDIGTWVNGPKEYKKFLKDNHMEEIY